MSQPLPVNPYNIGTHPYECNAYATCLTYEMEAIAGSHHATSGPQSVVLARVLGYMIIHAPTALGRTNVSNAVTSSATTEGLVDLAKLYMTNFIRCFKSAKPGDPPVPSSHPSRPSFDNVSDTFLNTLLEAPQDYQKAKTLVSPKLETERNDAVASSHIQRIAVTHCAHIFPEPVNHNVSGENEGDHKHQYATSVWAVIEFFGQVLGVEELNGPHIHRIENVMTMDSDFHYWFGSLDVWLEATVSAVTWICKVNI
ncbi:hypothetical protein FIBSPDRAFT_843242 [Athelia psychrophila]|uniref:Uncharacterized protein n=1 Tax=Athelia psychrophila TaxID=1759441 RepID=A0A167VN88_9AGAM|nr:hypothetical protein FIBSPDRAFT_843242 [Fibularhizoctonia sp. CBS 109695]